MTLALRSLPELSTLVSGGPQPSPDQRIFLGDLAKQVICHLVIFPYEVYRCQTLGFRMALGPKKALGSCVRATAIHRRARATRGHATFADLGILLYFM